jgi:hypothetical protein
MQQMIREYNIDIFVINDTLIEKLIIDPHVDKHSDHLDDAKIIKIVLSINGEFHFPIKVENGYSYFASKLFFERCWYKLVWLTEEKSNYIGVITVVKDRRIK